MKLKSILLSLLMVLVVANTAAAGMVDGINYDKVSKETELLLTTSPGDNPWKIYRKWIPGKITLKKVEERIMSPNGITDPLTMREGITLIIKGKDLNYLLPIGLCDEMLAPGNHKSVGDVEVSRLKTELAAMTAKAENYKKLSEELGAQVSGLANSAAKLTKEKKDFSVAKQEMENILAREMTVIRNFENWLRWLVALNCLLTVILLSFIVVTLRKKHDRTSPKKNITKRENHDDYNI